MILAILVYVALAIMIGFFGRNRKFGYWGYFFCSLLLTPIIGLLVLIASYPTKYKTERVYDCPEEFCK